jgi:type IV pilus assembly protein PilA
MPTRIKGMTSIEIAVLVGIVLIIAIAVAWYLYSTFAASVGNQPYLRVISAWAYADGTIKVEVMNTGTSAITVSQVEVFGTIYPVEGGLVVVPPMHQATVVVKTGRWIRLGAIIQGKLITEEGYVIPFSARRVE